MGSKAQQALLASLQQQLNDARAAQAAQQARVDAAINDARTQDPYTATIAKQAQAVSDAAQSGDYSTLPKGIFFDYVDPAMKKRQRDLTANAGGLGVSAIGTPNSTLLNLNKENLDDQFARDEAANYQTNVSNAVSGAAQTLGTLGSAETAKKFNILSALGGNLANATAQTNNASNNYLGYAAQQANKPSKWNTFFKAALGGLSGLAAA